MTPPVKVIHNWLPAEMQRPLFDALECGPWHALKLRYGNTARRKNIVFYEGDPEAAYAYTKAATDKDRPILYTEGPAALRTIRKRLQEEYGFSFSLCYVNYYADEQVGIGWHNDAEEVGSQIPVRMLCLGGTRDFSIWKVMRDEKTKKLLKPFAEWEVKTRSGDLVEMPVGFHEENAYRHAILPQKQFAAPRVSLTFRSPDLSANGPWAPETFVHIPRIWCCKSGHEYPKDAIYVGCRTIRGQAREGSPFGNAVDPFRVRNQTTNPWLADNDTDFRLAALTKMQDSGFRQQMEALRGRDLLCWCEQEGPKRAEFCHARVWLDLINGNHSWTGE